MNETVASKGPRWRRLGKWVIGAAICGAVLVGVANAIVLVSTDDHVFEAEEAIVASETAIVPGARVWSDGTPSPALTDRLACALRLFNAGKVRTILVSGDHGAPEYDEPNAMRTWLIQRGVPSEAVFMDHAGFRTFDTMQRAARVFGVDRAVVCTQAFHLPRSVFLARDAGIDAVGLKADSVVDPNAAWNGTREAVARVRAVFDAKVWNSEPAHLGPQVLITGRASATHDPWTP